MAWVSTKNVKDILKKGIVSFIKDLRIFSAIQVGEDVYAADSNNDVLPLIAGNNITITPTEEGIRIDSKASGTSIRLNDVSGVSITLSGTSASLTWTDPENIVINDITLAAWAGTKVVRKIGSAPEDEMDGTVIVNNIVKNQYSSEGYVDTGLEYDTMYYYRFFPYTEDNIVTKGTSDSVIPVREVISTLPSQSGSLEYDGTEQTASFNNFDSTKLDVTGNTGTNADNYTATFTPKTGYKWSDGSITGKEVTWKIDKQKVSIPSLDSSVIITYDGTEKNAIALGAIIGYNSAIMNVSGDTGTNAGSQTATFTLKDTSNYEWNGSDASVTWSIAKATYHSTVSIANYTYKGTKSTPTVSDNPENGAVTFYGREASGGTGTSWDNITSTTYNAGIHYCYAIIAETDNYEECITSDVAFVIAKATFSVSVSISDYTYAGTKSSPSVSNNPGGGTVTYYGRATASGTATAWENVTATTYNAGTRYCYAVIAETTNYEAVTTGNTSFTIEKAAGAATLSKTSVTLDADNPTASVTVTGATGTISVGGSSDSTVATASISGNTVTISNVNKKNGTAKITLNIAVSTNYKATTKEISVTTSFSQIYGVEWDGTSTTKCSRTDAASGFTDPSPAVNNGSGSSPFDNISPWKDMEKVERAGGTMVKIPKFYYKITKSGKAMKFQISATKEIGFSVSPAHMDRGDGKGERDVIYVGRHHCTDDYKSKTGVKPIHSITRATARTNIHNLGSTIWQWDYATLLTIQILYLVEFADWDSQTKIGYGCSPGKSMDNMGGTDAMQYHTGTSAANRTTYGWTQYRYIEGLWDNIRDWCDGVYFNKADIYAIKNPADFSDTANGTKVGTRPTSGGYISEYAISSVSGFEYFMYPSAVAGSDSTYVPDYCQYGANGVTLSVGGEYSNYKYYGLFLLMANTTASNYTSTIGSRLMELP